MDGAYVSAGTVACPKGSLAYEEKNSLITILLLAKTRLKIQEKTLFYHKKLINVAIDKKM